MLIESLEHILEGLHQAQVGVLDAACYSHGLFIWGMLQAWQVQQFNLSNSFKDDPGLGSIYIRCMLLQGHSQEVKAQVSKIESSLVKL